MATMTDPEARRFEYQLVAIAGGCVGFAVLADTAFRGELADASPAIPTGLILTLTSVGFVVLTVGLVGLAWLHHRYFFSFRQRLRRDLGGAEGGAEGYLDVSDLRESCGERAVLTEAERFWRRPAGSMTVAQASWVIGEPISGRWPVRGKLIRVAYPRSAGVVGPQGSAKSQYLIPLILDVPGPAVVTSTKCELFDATAAWRQAHNGPVYVFDPLDMTGGYHNFPFDPVRDAAQLDRRGRATPGYADAIATAMVRGAQISKRLNEEFWADAGREILRCYLVAANLEGGGSELVQQWAHHPDDADLADIMRKHTEEFPTGWLGLYEKRLADPDKMRAGYFSTVVSCTDYLGEPAAAAACQAARTASFTMAGFLAERCTLYIVGDKSKRGMAALMTALTESLAYQAREIAKASKVLSEPLVLFLDEVANLTPIDLPTWASEFRGWGVMVMPVLQSRAQLDQIWGADNGKIIWDNLITKVIMGSLGDDEFLESLSRLGGERRVRRSGDTDTARGLRGSVVLERSIPLGVIAALPRFYAYTLGEARHPAVVAFEPGFRRLDREHTDEPWRPAWPCWWRHPVRAMVSALELGRH